MTSAVVQSAIATQSMKIHGGYPGYTTGDLLPDETALPTWSTGFGIVAENIISTSVKVGDTVFNVTTPAEKND